MNKGVTLLLVLLFAGIIIWLMVKGGAFSGMGAAGNAGKSGPASGGGSGAPAAQPGLITGGKSGNTNWAGIFTAGAGLGSSLIDLFSGSGSSGSDTSTPGSYNLQPFDVGNTDNITNTDWSQFAGPSDSVNYGSYGISGSDVSYLDSLPDSQFY